MFDCAAIAPAWFCQHRDVLLDVLLYLAPSLLLALVIRRLSSFHPVFFLFTLAGTICHELAHFCVGLLTGARPAGFSVMPRRMGRSWQLGSVSLTRVRWYNAAPVALAPFLVAAVPLAVALWRTHPGWQFQPLDLLLAFAVAPQFLACWPSAVDWKIALRSWPYVPLIALAWYGAGLIPGLAGLASLASAGG
jgi:hypothetical protein